MLIKIKFLNKFFYKNYLCYLPYQLKLWRLSTNNFNKNVLKLLNKKLFSFTNKQPSTIDIEKGCANNGYSCDANLDKNYNVTTNCEISGDGKKCLNNNFDEKNLLLNKKSVVCRVALYTVCLFTTIVIITLLWLYMGWMYGVPAIFVAIIAILVASRGWHWFYIAFVTTPRDVK